MRRNNRSSDFYSLTINALRDLIQRSHRRREEPLRQRKTRVSPALHKNYPYHFTVHCARGHAIRHHDLEQADISFMPIGHAPQYDHPPANYGGQRFLERQTARDWRLRRWFASWGIKVYTGTPSGRDNAEWHDIYFKYDAIRDEPDAVLTCIEALVNAVANPLLTLTKSGELRFSCRVQDYLHPSTDEAKQYIHKHTPTIEDPNHRDVYLEILGDKGYSHWDGRYEIYLGNLLNPPIIAKEVLFAPIDALRDALHQPAPPKEDESEPTAQVITVAPLTPVLVDERVVAVREGKLSPLAIKRPTPVLRKSDLSQEIPTLHVLEHDVKTGWLRAVDGSGAYLHFREIRISKDILDAWSVNWQGSLLGNFAKALLHALESRGELYESPVRRVRMTMQAFEPQEEMLIQYMNEDKPNGTFWHQLKRFYAHYKRDADAPMVWDDGMLRFWLPSVSETKKELPDEMKNTKSEPWILGNRVFQIRTGTYMVSEFLNYDNSWDYLGFSESGKRFFHGICVEAERAPSIQHAVVCGELAAEQLRNVAPTNVSCMSHIKKTINVEGVGQTLESADVIWIVGAPYWPPYLMWKQAQILFGSDAKPLRYDVEFNPYHYEDKRIQRLCEQNIVSILTQVIGRAGLDRLKNKTVLLITSIPLPGITDRLETLLFDWEDFEIAGRLDKLPEVIAKRQQFENERDNLTSESDRQKVEQILGISKSQANRVLMKLRGGKIERVPFHEQIHSLLEGGEKTTAELIAAIDGHPGAVKNELKRLVDIGEIVKVRRAVYALPSE